MFSLLKERRLRWLGHVRRIEDGRLPKDIHYSELADGSRTIGGLLFLFKNVYKRDLEICGIDIANWVVVCTERSKWRNFARKCKSTTNNSS